MDELEDMVLVRHEDVRTSSAFFAQVVKPLLKRYRPDLLWIDPALAYIGGEANSQQDVGRFLRNDLNPLLRQFDCGGVIVHHTAKPPTGKQKRDWQAGDLAYLGAGSAEWANWARAVLALRSVGSHDVYELRAAKRGGRLDWRDQDGNKAYVKYLAHSKDPGVICWTETAEDAVLLAGRPKAYDVEELLELLPLDGLTSGEWGRLCKKEYGVSDRTFFRERKNLERAGRIIKSQISGKIQPLKKS